MNNVTVNREELIKRLETNRTAHRDVFLEAQKRYRELAIAELDAMLAEARAGKRIRRSVTLIEPQDHTSDYDLVLDMLGMEVGETIAISQQEFSCYARDEWAWRQQWTATNATYGIDS